jgi:hypothetical protein
MVAGISQAEGELSSPAGKAFDIFIRGWMGDLEREASQQRPSGRFLMPAAPSDQPETYTYREYSDDYQVEMKETGKPAAPYVGILHYVEETYVCRGPAREDCDLVESSPITEIFPFRDGRWQY